MNFLRRFVTFWRGSTQVSMNSVSPPHTTASTPAPYEDGPISDHRAPVAIYLRSGCIYGRHRTNGLPAVSTSEETGTYGRSLPS